MKTRLLVWCLGVVIVLLVATRGRSPLPEPVPPRATGAPPASFRSAVASAPVPSAAPGTEPTRREPEAAPAGPALGRPTNWLQRLQEDGAARLPRAVLERWQAGGHTNAEDLLAARQAGGGAEFLRQALTKFPNDPRVLFAATAADAELNGGPEGRRERLDRFQAAAPENALADYLSAADHLKHGRPEQALADLLAASAKTRFDDYVLDAMQNAEDLYLEAGKTPLEAKVLGGSTALLPHLAQLKGLAQNMASLQSQYLAAGDTASAQNLAEMGLRLGQHLTDGDGSRFLINQLVGVAIERLVLAPLDPQQTYDFLQDTPGHRLEQLQARRAASKEMNQFAEQWSQTASEPELLSFFDRTKIYGDAEAMAWLRKRQGASAVTPPVGP